MSSVEAAQGRLGVPVTGEWDAVTEGAAVAYQSSGEGFLRMDPSAHIDPPTLINVGYYNPLDELPEKQRDYLAGGERPGTFMRDIGTAINQVPRWGWAVGAGVFYMMAYMSYSRGSAKKAV